MLVIGIAALALAMVSTVNAAPLSNYDFPLSSSLVASNSTVILSNAPAFDIPPYGDLTITATMNASGTNYGASNPAFYGIDLGYGPNGTQWTTTQPITGTNILQGTTNVTAKIFVARSNLVGAVKGRVSLFGTTSLTNANLIEISGNWNP